MVEEVLSFENITKLYGSHPALIDVSFSIKPGEIFGLLGPNGAGKTTAISICSGLLRPNKGHVKIFGNDLSSNPVVARKQLGVVPQELALYEDLTALENLVFWGKLAGFSASDSKQKANDLLQTLDLQERYKDKVKTFSGGMKRRMNIGCALMHDPKLLLLDEPTVGVDPQARERMIEWMKNWVGGEKSILYTTHYLDEAERICNTVAIIDDGRILKSAPLSELLTPTGDSNMLIADGDFASVSDEIIKKVETDFSILSKSDSSVSLVPLQPINTSEAVNKLIDSGLGIDRISFNKVDLHDIFLSLTGKSLRE